MRPAISPICVLIFPALVAILTASAHAADRIHAPTDPRPELSQALADLTDYLEQISGRPFTVVNEPHHDGHTPEDRHAADAPAFRLARADRHAAELPPGADALRARNAEAFQLFTEPDGPVWIIGNTDNAIANGIYAYLEKLGVRWLLPSDTWTIVPQRASVRLDLDELHEPAFISRGFFGTGGFGGILPLDSEHRLRNRWNDWKRRLRYSGQMQLHGHSYESFNLKHRETLEAHPEYRPLINGERVPWSIGMKMCFSNEEVRELFVQDRLQKLQWQIDRDPDGPTSFAVSVDPSDGGGYCESEPCLALGSVSDRVFGLANQVARAVQEQHPDRFVSLYAYNEHAAVPDIELEPNIYVMLVPYGFQRTGMTPEQFVDAWADKIDRLAIYSYWGVTDWSRCLPSFSLYRQAEPQLNHWRDAGVEAFALESSTNGGGVGWLLYVVAQMVWDDTLDAKAALRNFCDDAFGDAAEPMFRMFNRWAGLYLRGDHELGLAYRDLQEAFALTDDPAVQARLRDLVLYVHYQRLMHEYESQPAKSQQSAAAAERVIRCLWRTYDNTMVQPFRMHVLLTNRFESHAADQLNAAFPLKDPDAEVWAALEPYSDADADALLRDGLETYRPRTFERREFAGPYVPLHRRGVNTRPAAEDLEPVITTILTGDIVYELLIPRGLSKLTFEFRAQKQPESYLGNQMQLLDREGRTVDRRFLPCDGQWHTITVPVPKPGRYTLRIHDRKAFCRLKLAPAYHPTLTSPLHSGDLTRRRYFYVPRGQRRIALYEKSVVVPEIFDSRGKPVDLQGQRGMIVIDVPRGEDGKVWSFQKYKSWEPLRLINIPHAIGLTAETLLVPRDALIP